MTKTRWVVTAERVTVRRPHGRQPLGLHHARRREGDRTACGLRVTGWPVFPQLAFPRPTPASEVCEYCADAVHEDAAKRQSAEQFQDELINLVAAQSVLRGDWPDPRDAVRPEAPWPSRGGVVLRYLLWRAETNLAQGTDPRTVLLDLATTAWFEGGVENYDRGQRDARGSIERHQAQPDRFIP